MTANSRCKQLRALWQWAFEQKFVDRMPPSRLKIREPRPAISTWTSEDLQALFSAAAKHPGGIGAHWANEYWSAMLWVAFNTGERTGALHRIMPDMFDLEAGTLEIPAEIRKAERVDMKWLLTPSCVEAVRPLVARARGPVFDCGYAQPQNIYRKYNEVLDCAGLGRGRRNGFQRIRRTVSSWIKLRGGDPGVWLGHAPKNVADGHYIDRWTVQQHSEISGRSIASTRSRA